MNSIVRFFLNIKHYLTHFMLNHFIENYTASPWDGSGPIARGADGTHLGRTKLGRIAGVHINGLVLAFAI